MEGISFGLCDSLQIIRELGTEIERVYASGGAAESVMWRQMLADIFDAEIVTTNVTQGAAFGAAMLAGIGTGLYRDAIQASEALINITGSNTPDQKAHAVYQSAYEIYGALYPRLKDTFKMMNAFSQSGE